ncbi:MAG: hypothetical protein HRU19_15505 [Pseudobacteriovorax sp.]|nr:hypothetical protein [Pseudobacteriovorax sp.]
MLNNKLIAKGILSALLLGTTITSCDKDSDSSGVENPSVMTLITEAADDLSAEDLLGDNKSSDAISSDLVLPAKGKHEVAITWKSDDTTLIKDNGAVQMSNDVFADHIVTLSATFSLNGESRVKKFVFVVTEEGLKLALTAFQALENDIPNFLNENTKKSEVKSDLNLYKNTESGLLVEWNSSNPNVVSNDGVVRRPSHEEGNADVTLTAVFSHDSYVNRKTKTIQITVVADAFDSETALNDALDFLTDESILGENTSKADIKSNLDLKTLLADNVVVTWESNNSEVIKTNGEVIRPAFSLDSVDVKLTATLTLGELSRTKEFDLTVTKLPMTDREILNEEKGKLTLESILGANSDKDSITVDLVLEKELENGVTVEWISSQEDIIKKDGRVSRPKFEDGDKPVTLTAIIKKGEESDSLQFSLKVLRAEQSDQSAVDAALSTFDFDSILSQNANLDSIRTELELTNSFAGVDVIWESSNAEIVSNAGHVTRPAADQEAIVIQLTAKFMKNNAVSRKVLDLTVLPRSAELINALDSVRDRDYLADNRHYEGKIVSNLNLFDSWDNGITVTWESSHPSIIALSGALVSPTPDMDETTVTLTATFELDGEKESKSFDVQVPNQLERAKILLDEDKILGDNFTPLGLTNDLVLPPYSGNANVTWTSNSFFIVVNPNRHTAKVYTPTAAFGDAEVTLTATISIDTDLDGAADFETTKDFDFIVLAGSLTPRQIIDRTIEKLNDGILLGDNASLTEVTSDLNLITEDDDLVKITWESSHPEVLSTEGVVTRPTNGEAVDVTLKAKIERLGDTDEVTFTVTVK